MYNWRKDIVTWKVQKTLYISVPFTWLLPEAEKIARAHKGKVIAGGPAVALMGTPWADETPAECIYDVMGFYNPCMTKTTRGCPQGCAFCGVRKIEGEYRELPTWKIAPIVCDSNLLASSDAHFEKVIDGLTRFPYVDLQGISALYLTGSKLNQLRRLRGAKLRIGFDNIQDEYAVKQSVERLKYCGFGDIGIYVLIGFDDTPDEARYKLEIVRSWGIRPTPMRYQPLDTLKKNSYVHPNWTSLELRRMSRYYSRLRWFEHIPYEDFEYLETEKIQEEIPF